MEQLLALRRPRTFLEPAREQPQGYASFILWKRHSGISLPEKVPRTQMWGKVDTNTRDQPQRTPGFEAVPDATPTHATAEALSQYGPVPPGSRLFHQGVLAPP